MLFASNGSQYAQRKLRHNNPKSEGPNEHQSRHQWLGTNRTRNPEARYRRAGFELAAVNDLADVENLAYLLRFDTVYGRYSKPVFVNGGGLVIAGRKLQILSVRDPSELPWKDLGIELVFECTGAFTRREDLEKHIRAGARKR